MEEAKEPRSGRGADDLVIRQDELINGPDELLNRSDDLLIRLDDLIICLDDLNLFDVNNALNNLSDESQQQHHPRFYVE